ncbi:MAG: hypothetical protein JW786_07515 [Desulfobacterales bacterium]|nr:hypothetical protein [Desulfobacterales bacterium]
MGTPQFSIGNLKLTGRNICIDNKEMVKSVPESWNKTKWADFKVFSSHTKDFLYRCVAFKSPMPDSDEPQHGGGVFKGRLSKKYIRMAYIPSSAPMRLFKTFVLPNMSFKIHVWGYLHLS